MALFLVEKVPEIGRASLLQVIQDFIATQKTRGEGVIIIGKYRLARNFNAPAFQPLPKGSILGLEKLVRPPAAEPDSGAPRGRDFADLDIGAGGSWQVL